MLKFSKKSLPGLMIILVMLLGAWTVPGKPASDEGGEKHPDLPKQVEASQVISDQGSLELNDKISSAAKGAQERVKEINSYKVDFGKVSSDSEFDKQFVEEAITSNSLELWTMEYAYPHIKDPNLKNLVQVMLEMHSTDQKTIIELAKIVGVDTTADFVNASVYPETPDWDLGMRTEDLRMDYLDPLVEESKQPFDERALDILDQEHTGDVQSELTAERVVENPELKAFAKHSADVTELHLQLLDVVHAYMQGYDEPPSVDFSEPYMDPHEYTVNGSSTTSSSK
jgi:hypothetical protein